VPAFLRSVIERRGDARTITLAKHESFPALSAYDPAYAALKHSKLERLLEKEETNPDAQLDYEQRNLMAFAATEEVPYDSSGRIVLPPMMRRKGGIDDLALFLGTGETFQIWNPKLFLAEPRVPDDMKDIARFRLEERGLKL
jgi:MraZ protein